MATVASWYPGKYWLVSTVQLDESSVKNYQSSKFLPSVEFIQPTWTDSPISTYCGDSWGSPIHVSSRTLEELGFDMDKRITPLKTSVPIGKAVPAPNKFVTQIFRCNKTYFKWSKTPIASLDNLIDVLRATAHLKGERSGYVRFEDLPLFEREYFNLSDARAGHKETVELLAQGRLVMKS